MKYINKRLTLEKVNFQKIAEKFGTPFYCYSYSKLKENVNKFKKEPIDTTFSSDFIKSWELLLTFINSTQAS